MELLKGQILQKGLGVKWETEIFNCFYFLKKVSPAI